MQRCHMVLRRCLTGFGSDFLKIFPESLKEINYQGRIISEPFPTPGGEVGRDIKVWRDLIEDSSEVVLDAEAAYLLSFEKKWMNG